MADKTQAADHKPVRECCSQCNPFFDMQCHVEGCEYYAAPPKTAESRFPGTISRQKVMDLIEAEIPLWTEVTPPRHALSVLWGKVRDMKEVSHAD